MSKTPFYPPSGIYSDSYYKDMRILKTRTQWILSVVSLVFLFALPHIPFLNSSYFLRLVIGAGITVIICLGLNILTGYCGQLNIGQSAFVMVGAFTSGLLNAYLGCPFWASVIPAGLAAAVVGTVFGIPSARLKGLYLALTTLGAQIIITWIALFGLTITAAGFSVEPVKLGGTIFNTPEKFHYVAMFFTVVMTFFAKNMMRSKLGRAISARRFPGAALLAGEAAYRCGAGLVTIAGPESLQLALAGHLREATWLPLPEVDGWIAEGAASLVLRSLERVTGMLLGPGFGREATTRDFLYKLLGTKLPPLVVDADGLKLLAELPAWEKRLPADTVLTPHPGEMAILTGLSMQEIQGRRIEIAEEYAQIWKHVVVLKGAFTTVASPNGRSATLPLATPALARAGTGDVLAGLITGLRAQEVPAFEAACSAVWLHGQAGLRAAGRLGGTAGLLAGDLIRELPALIGR